MLGPYIKSRGTRGTKMSANADLITVETYSTNHVYLHRPNAFGFWQTRLHLLRNTQTRFELF